MSAGAWPVRPWLRKHAKWRSRMVDLVLTTFDWVPETPRGFVRDLRVRWALEEAGLPYRVESVPFRDRGTHHFSYGFRLITSVGRVWATSGSLCRCAGLGCRVRCSAGR